MMIWGKNYKKILLYTTWTWTSRYVDNLWGVCTPYISILGSALGVLSQSLYSIESSVFTCHVCGTCHVSTRTWAWSWSRRRWTWGRSLTAAAAGWAAPCCAAPWRREGRGLRRWRCPRPRQPPGWRRRRCTPGARGPPPGCHSPCAGTVCSTV